jgi:hypothetical protein
MNRVGRFVLALLLASSTASATGGGQATDVRAAFLLNFAKFTEWPDMPPAAPVILCIADNARLAVSTIAITRGQQIDRHPIEVRAIGASNIPLCHVLFVSSDRDIATILQTLKGQPVLTVSDAYDFASRGGMIELFLEHDRMRFAIDIDAVKRCRLTLSSRLLGLAKIVKDDRGQ